MRVGSFLRKGSKSDISYQKDGKDYNVGTGKPTKVKVESATKFRKVRKNVFSKQLIAVSPSNVVKLSNLRAKKVKTPHKFVSNTSTPKVVFYDFRKKKDTKDS